MEDLLKQLNVVLDAIETGIKEKKFPETIRLYVQQLDRRIREFLTAVEVSVQENTIQTPISPSSRSALYNLRKAYYATLSRLVKEARVDKNRSLEEWRRAVSRIIEEYDRRGLSETPSKIILSYEIKDEGGVRYIALKEVRIFYFELEGILKVDVSSSEAPAQPGQPT
uniref:DUF2258 domain-containing protein n=1 Tax=Thermofilum pendens TaxID=2269 RepID=A0A7C4FDR5_THEPE